MKVRDKISYRFLVYFIKQGKIKLYYDVLRNNPDTDEQLNLPFIAYVEGSYFGDSDIFSSEETGTGGVGGRDGTAMADSEVHLMVLGKKDLVCILEEFEDLSMEIRQIARERKTYHEQLINQIVEDFKQINYTPVGNHSESNTPTPHQVIIVYE